MKNNSTSLRLIITSVALSMYSMGSIASSHMDAPLITLDPAANTTDVYAFRSSQDNVEYLTTALAVYPFEEPGIGPNNYRFDDNVLYEIHVALGDDVLAGRKTLSYQFKFDTQYSTKNSILQTFAGLLTGELDSQGFDANQILRQSYKVTRVDYRQHKRGEKTELGMGRVPPNNQGMVTPLYNQDNNGEKRAKEGVNSSEALDTFTQQAIFKLSNDYMVFAGQRDDGFYADIQSIFDLDFAFSGPNKPFDSQGGYNIHGITFNIPLHELGEGEVVGVWATTSRQRKTILRTNKDPKSFGKWVQVGRQGNPLFNEALVILADKDLYNRTTPERDAELFKDYALNPQLAAVLKLDSTDRQDIAGIFIPDLIKVNVTTDPARLAGSINDSGFSRLSVFGGDTLLSQSGKVVAGGFPNGRRFGDDVVDIALLALVGDPAPSDEVKAIVDDGVQSNDISYNKVFPYAATPHNGRNHVHH